MQKLSEQGAKIVAVGDPNQGIYRFRGADGDAFGNLSQTLTDLSANKDVEMPLTGNFRSRKAVLDFTNAEGEDMGHVDNLKQGRPWNREGAASKYEMGYDDAFGQLKQEMNEWGETRQTAFLARTNEPLVHASLRLMKEGIPFVILGKDIAGDLLDHIYRISKLSFLKNESDVYELQSAMAEFLEEKSERYAAKAAKAAALQELKETTDALNAAIEQFMEDSGQGNIQQFTTWLKKKFGGVDIEAGGRQGDQARKQYKEMIEKQNPVILSTVHKSKGLQFERVYILRDDLWPHPKSTRPEDISQELNNKYIGRTRAEDEVPVLDLEDQPGYPGKKGGGGGGLEDEQPERPPKSDPSRWR